MSMETPEDTVIETPPESGVQVEQQQHQQPEQVQSQPEQASQSPPPVWQSAAERLGFAGVASESDFLTRLDEYNQYQQQQQQQIAQLQQLAAIGNQYLMQQHAPQQPAAPQAQPEKKGPWWASPPAVDERELEFWKNPDGTLKPTTPPDIARTVQQREAYRKRFINELVNNPSTVFQEAIETQRETVMKWIDEREQRRDAERAAMEIQRQNADLLYARDPRTRQFAIDPMTGQPQMSPLGQDAAYYIQQVRAAANDPQKMWQVATALLARDYYQSLLAGQQQATPAAPNATNQLDERNRQHQRALAQAKPNRGGARNAAGEQPRQKGRTLTTAGLMSEALADLQEQGVA